MASTHIISGLSDREACIDAVHRLLEGIDTNDMTLVESSFHADGILDLSDAVPLGIGDSSSPRPGVLDGREAVIGSVRNGVGRMDTTHMMTNSRVRLSPDGATAHLYALALAQHYRPGAGRDIAKVGCLMGNSYHIDLSKDGEGVWKMDKMVLKCTWWEGDKSNFGI